MFLNHQRYSLIHFRADSMSLSTLSFVSLSKDGRELEKNSRILLNITGNIKIIQIIMGR